MRSTQTGLQRRPEWSRGHALLLLTRGLSLKCVGHEASVGSLGDKGMPRSHNLKAQKAEGTEQGGCRRDRRDTIKSELLSTIRAQGLETKACVLDSMGSTSLPCLPLLSPLENLRKAVNLPRSSRFLWKQMKTWSTWSCSSANSRRTAKLKFQHQELPTRTTTGASA